MKWLLTIPIAAVCLWFSAGEPTEPPPAPAEPAAGPTLNPPLGGVVGPLKIEPLRLAAPETSRATSHPHGQQHCASGCVASNHPTPLLTRDRCRTLLAAYQKLPADASSAPLDALLFHGSQTAGRLRDTELVALLDEAHRDVLTTELARERLVVELRLVDDKGRVRASLPPTVVPQHVRQEFEMRVVGLQPLVTSGTLKRVGRNRVWQRL